MLQANSGALADQRNLYVVMGPSGCGKSTIAHMLAERTGAAFIEADDFHPESNKANMASGTPLTDTDRAAWLDDLEVAVQAASGARLWLACSALTPYVQSRLLAIRGCAVRFVVLDVAVEALAQRLEQRRGHFMSPDLLDSQLAALEAPDNALRVNGEQSPEAVAEAVLRLLDEGREQ